VPERLNRVTVKYSRGEIVLPWASRDALLAELSQLDSAKGIRDAFEAVGASRPVELSPQDTGLLIEVIDMWTRRIPIDQLPKGIWNLRNALLDDLHDTTG
jgi:hypothetical protein